MAPELLEHLKSLNARVNAQAELLKLCLAMLARDDRECIEQTLRTYRRRLQESRFEGDENPITQAFVDILEGALYGGRGSHRHRQPPAH
jgi:hypothetical protein